MVLFLVIFILKGACVLLLPDDATAADLVASWYCGRTSVDRGFLVAKRCSSHTVTFQCRSAVLLRPGEAAARPQCGPVSLLMEYQTRLSLDTERPLRLHPGVVVRVTHVLVPSCESFAHDGPQALRSYDLGWDDLLLERTPDGWKITGLVAAIVY